MKKPETDVKWKERKKEILKPPEKYDEYLTPKDPSGSLFDFDLSGSLEKFSKYELTEVEGHLCIVPVKEAKREVYEPFQRYPEILLDFVNLVHPDLLNDIDEHTFGKRMLKFVNDYGLFYGAISGFKASLDTYERVSNIMQDIRVRMLAYHLDYLSYYLKNKPKPDENVVIKGVDHGYEWHMILQYSIREQKLAIMLGEDNRWKLIWAYNHLMDVLEILYLKNCLGWLGTRINACRLEECNQIYIKQNAVYCCDEHGNTHRKRQERHRKEACKEIISDLKSLIDDKNEASGDILNPDDWVRIQKDNLLQGFLTDRQLKILDGLYGMFLQELQPVDIYNITSIIKTLEVKIAPKKRSTPASD